jgi:hypothetical protein
MGVAIVSLFVLQQRRHHEERGTSDVVIFFIGCRFSVKALNCLIVRIIAPESEDD